MPPQMPGQNPDIRFEVHIQATLPHSTEVESTFLNEELGRVEGWFREHGGDVTISFVRTTKGAEDAPAEAGTPDQSYM